MSEVWFYHLQRQSLERALPMLLERSLERGWKAVVQAVSEERLQSLDDLLWTYSDESFMPHGRGRDGDPLLQAVWLTTGRDNPNGAAIRFFVEGADPIGAAHAEYQRTIVIFDGNDDEQVVAAREQWRRLKEQGAALAYWRQGEDGRWEKTA
ncbi:MAG TPA: DNA polymerase III subunit chi [Beijerinckiaceae bacterium]|nr:DNA polymerase III subunit chi [Beijerinckiaceae bacterium]